MASSSSSILNQEEVTTISYDDSSVIIRCISILSDPSQVCGLSASWQVYVKARREAMEEIRTILAKYSRNKPCYLHHLGHQESMPTVKSYLLYPMLDPGYDQLEVTPEFLEWDLCWNCVSKILEGPKHSTAINRLIYFAKNSKFDVPVENFNTNYTSWNSRECLFINKIPGSCLTSNRSEDDIAEIDTDLSTPTVYSHEKIVRVFGDALMNLQLDESETEYPHKTDTQSFQSC